MPSGSARDLFAVQLAISPECAKCSALEKSIDRAFFYYPVVWPLCKLPEGFMVRILGGKFFAWKPVLCAAMCYRSWTGTLCVSLLFRHYACRDLDNETERTPRRRVFSSQTLVSFYKHQIKVKIRSERKRLSFLEFGKRWVTVARLCRVVGASLIFSLDITRT